LEAWFEVRRTELEREFKDNPDKVNDILDFTRSLNYIVLAGSVTGQFFIALLTVFRRPLFLKTKRLAHECFRCHTIADEAGSLPELYDA